MMFKVNEDFALNTEDVSCVWKTKTESIDVPFRTHVLFRKDHQDKITINENCFDLIVEACIHYNKQAKTLTDFDKDQAKQMMDMATDALRHDHSVLAINRSHMESLKRLMERILS